MSHQPERKEKNCLNCGVEVQGRFCHRCGQENIITHQGFWSLTKHFVYDIFHFDGKFFDTLQYLFFSPGRVPKDYVLGRRNRYLDPIRMYLFTSAIFFLIFFSTQKMQTNFVSNNSRYLSIPERFQEAAKLYPPDTMADSAAEKKLNILLDTTITLRLDPVKNKKSDTLPLMEVDGELYTMNLEPASRTFNDVDSSVKISWIDRHFEQKWTQYKKQYGDNINQMMGDLMNRFFHWFPYILFVSLPFFAFILKLLFLRNKKFVYSDHAVFTLYHFIFSFLLLLLILGLRSLGEKTGWGVFTILGGLLFFSWFVYLFISLRRFYEKSWGNTILKFILLNFLGFIAMTFIFTIFSIAFIFQL